MVSRLLNSCTKEKHAKASEFLSKEKAGKIWNLYFLLISWILWSGSSLSLVLIDEVTIHFSIPIGVSAAAAVLIAGFHYCAHRRRFGETWVYNFLLLVVFSGVYILQLICITITPFGLLLWGFSSAFFWYLANAFLAKSIFKIAIFITSFIASIIWVFFHYDTQYSYLIPVGLYAALLIMVVLREERQAFRGLSIKQKSDNNDIMQLLEMIPQGIAVVSKSLELKLCNHLMTELLEITEEKSLSSKELIFEAFGKIKSLKVRHDPSMVLPDPQPVQEGPDKTSMHIPIGNTPNISLRLPEEISHDSARQLQEASFLRFERGNKQSNLKEYILDNNLGRLLESYQARRNEKSHWEDNIIIDGKLETNDGEKSLEIILFCGMFDAELSLFFYINDVTVREKVAVLEDNNTFKDNILSSVSHELRTPLNCNLGMLESAIEDSNTPEKIKHHFLIPALRSAKLLRSIINDIVDFSQLRLNGMNLSLTKVSIRTAIEKCIELVEAQATKKGLKLKLDIPEDGTFQILTDENRLMQVVLNLLTNAVKYTFKGEIVVSIRNVFRNVKISINDTGIGLNQQEQDRLMSILEGKINLKQVNENSTGAALGLRVANAIAKLLGPPSTQGIYCQSKPMQGSSFSFFLENKVEVPSEGNTPARKTSQYLKFSDVEPKLQSPKQLKTFARFKTFNDFSSQRTQSQASNLISPSKFSSPHIEIMLPTQSAYTTKKFTKDDEFKLPLSSDVVPTSECKESTGISEVLSFRGCLNDNYNVLRNRSTSARISKVDVNFNKCSCKSILVVDDDAYNLLSIQTILGSFSLTADEALNGQECLQMVERRMQKVCGENCGMYKLVIMDFNMPLMGGLEATRKLREMEKTHGIPPMKIIGCTANHDKILESCRENGMDDGCSKPVTKQKLDLLLKQYYYSHQEIH